MSSVAAPPTSDGASPPPGSEGRPLRQALSRKRLLVGAAALLALLAVGGGAWLAASNATSSAAGAPIVTRSSENVEVGTGTMTQSISASGTLQPAQDSTLSFAVSGAVTAVDVTVGEKVKLGQTLAKIDPTVLADQVAADKSTLASDEDQLTSDENDGALSSTLDSQKAQVASAQSQLATAESNLADAVLKASFSGTVASVNLAVGDTVTGGGSGGSTASAGSAGSSASSTGTSSSGSSSGITVISTHAYTISTSVDDTEVSEVKVGDRATITPSGSSTSLSGKVASVSLIASSSSSGVAAFPVVIDVTGSPSGIYPGASATVSIILRSLKNVVEVPTAAISYAGGQATVTEVSAGSHKTVDVRTGASLNGETQITGGLRAGDTIVEEVTTFKTSSGTTRTLFGGSGTGTRGGFGRAGGFTGAGGPPGGTQGGSSSGSGALFGGGG